MKQEKRCHKATIPLPDSEPEIIDEEFFADLCKAEILAMCRGIGLSPFNVFLIGLHVRGLRDREIEAALEKYLPNLAGSKRLNAAAVKERRHYAVRRMNEKYGADVGLITVLHKAFRAQGV